MNTIDLASFFKSEGRINYTCLIGKIGDKPQLTNHLIILNFKVFYPFDIARDPIGWNVYSMPLVGEKLVLRYIPPFIFLR